MTLHDISKNCGWIQMKLSGQVGCVTTTNWFDFGEDPNPDPTAKIFKVILHEKERVPKTTYRTISQKCNGPDMFSWIRHCVAEVCALPSALLVSHVSLLYNHVFRIMKVNNSLCAPLMVGRGVRHGCPLSSILYSLCIEPLLIRLHASLPGFPVMPTERRIVIWAYADDVCVVVCNGDDVTMLLNELEKLSSACTTVINWNKCKALWIGHTLAVGLPHLPRGLQWEKESIHYQGVCIGTLAFLAKNWLNAVNKIGNRRGRALVIHNLVASLWHNMIALHPPEALLLTIQKHLLDFFLGWRTLSQAWSPLPSIGTGWPWSHWHCQPTNGLWSHHCLSLSFFHITALAAHCQLFAVNGWYAWFQWGTFSHGPATCGHLSIAFALQRPVVSLAASCGTPRHGSLQHQQLSRWAYLLQCTFSSYTSITCLRTMLYKLWCTCHTRPTEQERNGTQSGTLRLLLECAL